MSLQSLTQRVRIFKNGELVTPGSTEVDYSAGGLSGFSSLIVSASASDEPLEIPILRLGATIKLLELFVRENDLNKITVKVNSSAKAYKVSPIAGFSENITAITGSNSTASPVTLYWRVAYV